MQNIHHAIIQSFNNSNCSQVITMLTSIAKSTEICRRLYSEQRYLWGIARELVLVSRFLLKQINNFIFFEYLFKQQITITYKIQ